MHAAISCNSITAPSAAEPGVSDLRIRHYRWFALLAALDVLLTSIIMLWGGTESNAIARFAFTSLGVPGLAVLKLACVLVVVAVCERVNRERPRLALRLAQLAAGLNLVPVVFGFACLWVFFATLR